MTEEEYKWQQVEHYLEGGMDASERAAFETNMATDPHLAAMVEAAQLATEVVIGHEVLKLKEQMAKDLAKPTPNTTPYLLLPLLVLAIGTGAYFFFQPKTEKVKTEVIVHTTGQAKENTSEKQTTVLFTEKTKAQAKVKAAKTAKARETSTTPLQAPVHPTSTFPKASEPIPVPAAKEEGSPMASKVKEVPKDKCTGLKIELQYITQPTCANLNTGELHIKTETVKGGTAPYVFSLTEDKEFGPNRLQNLKEGTYTLFVKDVNECVVAYAKPIAIHKIVCEAPKEYSYNPAFDGAWKIPYDEAKKAISVKIIDKGGREVYLSHVHNGSPSEWNGESNTGSAIGLGYHTFLIEYSDGTVDKGAITILR